jgi:CRP-like cAMP-binding protein
VDDSHQSCFRNKLLAKLDPAAIKRLRGKANLTKLEPKQVLYRPEQKVREIYFPENAVICMLTVMENGETIESCTVGREGATWISASLHAPTMPCETIAVIGGDAYRIDVDTIEKELRQNGAFHDAVTSYAHALLIQCLRSAACNGLHSLQQRAARWILTTVDRTDVNSFAITHEFLSSLLGSTRSSVSLVVEALDKAGAIEIHRGTIKVADTAKLRKVVCECYEIIRRNHERING